MALPPDVFERSQLGFEFPQDLPAVSPLAFFLVGIVADHVATTRSPSPTTTSLTRKLSATC